MAKKKKKKSTSDEPFEESLAQLEGIVGDLEGGELGLADSLARYEEGIGRLKHCHSLLDATERRIELLSGVDAEGNPITEPFDGADTDEGLRAKQGSRSKKRSAPKRGSSKGGVDDRGRLF